LHVTAIMVSLSAWRALLLSASVAAAANITDDSYFYGQSPPVYPSRIIWKAPIDLLFSDNS
jgi:beta-glucosidase